MQKQQISSGTKWERHVGYSRAVRVGNIVEVSGTVAVDESNQIVGKGDPEAQARYIFEKIKRVLHEAGATLLDVIRTRMYVTNVEDWETIGRIHGEYFRKIKPAATMVEVSALIHSDCLVEVEVSAFILSR